MANATKSTYLKIKISASHSYTPPVSHKQQSEQIVQVGPETSMIGIKIKSLGRFKSSKFKIDVFILDSSFLN
jgi:hypothetical protein